MMENINRKIIVLGWDSATWDLVTPWVQAGKLPNLAALMAAGSCGTLESTPLPVSPAAWTTIITGQNPGKHGVFDWFERKPNSYDVEYVHTGRIGAKPLWVYFNERAQRMGIFNLPMMYPAVPIEGFMVSGLAAPGPHLPDFAYPKDLIAEIEANVGPYVAAEPQVFKRGREAEYLESMLAWSAYQEKVVRYLIENKPCDLYFFVFVQTDHAHHKFWRYQDENFPGYDPEVDSQFEDAILKIYQTLDDMLGNLRAELPADTTYMVVSDHGAGPMHGVMHVNRWLIEEGLLYLNRDFMTKIKSWLAKTNLVLKVYRLVAKLGLGNVAKLVSKTSRDKVMSSFISFDDVDWARTKAYSRGAFGQIFLNVKGREPHGIVEPGLDYENVLQDVLTRLRNLKHPETGQPLITDLHRRAEIYTGRHLDRAADINFSIQNYLYQSSVQFATESESILGPSEYEDSGSHRSNGLVVMAGPGIEAAKEIPPAKMEAITPTLLALANIPVPSNLDGKPLIDAFTLPFREKIRFVNVEDEENGGAAAPEMAPSELEDLEDRLRSLGYLG